MPANRNALIRYKTIDKCLQNRYRKWTLEDLIEACSDALYEYEGIKKGVSRRTVQADIQVMRSDKLGYNAPITVTDKKYYTYADRDYSITNIPLTDQDLVKLGETVSFLKQFKDFSHFNEMDAMVQKLEDHVASRREKRPPVVMMEKNENLRGLEHLDKLYRAITREDVVRITYQSFTAKNPNTFSFHPYVLKEFRNRWFLVGSRGRNRAVQNLALDRMLHISQTEEAYYKPAGFDTEEYFRDVIGVTVGSAAKPVKIVLFVRDKSAPYVLTKPFHASQKVVSRDAFGVTISLSVQVNIELERDLLAFGEDIIILQPQRLRRRVMERFRTAVERYQSELNELMLEGILHQFINRGFASINNFFSFREIRLILQVFKGTEQDHDIGQLVAAFNTKQAFQEAVFTRSLVHLLTVILPKAILVGFSLLESAHSMGRWNQGGPILLRKNQMTPGFTGWKETEPFWQVRPPWELASKMTNIYICLSSGSEMELVLELHPDKKSGWLTKTKRSEIINGESPVRISFTRGTAIMCNNLLLRRISGGSRKGKIRFLRLDFCNVNLPSGLEWAFQALVPEFIQP